MGKLWISLLLLFVAVANADLPVYDSNEAQDFYNYDNYDSIIDLDGKDGEEVLDEKFQNFDDDYQIEDNRSDLLEENNGKPEDSNENKAAESSFEEDLRSPENNKDNISLENKENVPKLEQANSKENDGQNVNLSDIDGNNGQSEEIVFDVDRDIESLPSPPKGVIDEENKKITSETENKLNEDGDFDNNYQLQDKNDDEQKIKDDNIHVIKNEDDQDIINENEQGKNDEYDFSDILDEDTVDMAYKDLNDDLAKLMETWKKLSLDGAEEEKDADDSIMPDKISEYEEKYGRLYNEGKVLSQRDDTYDEINGEKKVEEETKNESIEKQSDAKILTAPVAEAAVDSDVTLGKDENDVDDMVSAENDFENLEEEPEDYNENDEGDENGDLSSLESMSIENENDDDLSLHLSEEIKDDVPEDILGNNNEDKVDSISDIDVDKPLIEENKNTNNDNVKSSEAKADDVQNDDSENKPRMYSLDAILPNEGETEQDSTTTSQPQEDIKTMDVEGMSPEQYNQIMEQFKMLHKDELDVNSDTFDGNVAVIHVPISLDEPVVVESPNYPNPYPTNNIIDYMFEGDGVGIELNVTDLMVNGVGGDYLLVKPGGVDETGTDGLVFSYHLNEPRRYRFLDVDRMFVRFVAQPGWSFPFLRGFQLSVKLVAPLPRMEEEPLPEPEPELPEPVERLTLTLGGIPAVQFHRVKEEFRVLLADMATMYINANGIDPGLNTTLEVTQITGVTFCNMNWPNFENCTDVTFAVPLVYEEDEEEDEPRLNSIELNAMWNQYSRIDPFAARLRRMGVTEFASPNDSSILAVWFVISVGVLVIMAIMAFALWRYSCFDTYTRMPEFSSRDSLYNEKQGLDLYPTPHQTLPPLYESDLNWADDAKFHDEARVDMSCYTNRNFTRDELSDIESDEDVISTRDRKIVIAPKDGYEA